MEFTSLFRLTEHAWHSAELVKNRDRLNKKIDKVLEDRTRIDESRSRLLRGDVVTLEPAKLFESQGTAAVILFELLQRELQVRREMHAFYNTEATEQTEAFSRMENDVLAQEAELRKKLVAIGYIDGPPQTLGAIVPDFMMRHPGLRAAKAAAGVLRVYDRSHLLVNSEAMEQVEASLKEMLAKAVS